MFSACQKDVGVIVAVPTPISLDTTQFEGNFYGEIRIKDRALPPSDFDQTADRVLRVYVENGNIKVLNHVFPIDSLSQTHFDLSYIPDANTYDDSQTLTLVYSVDYKRIVLQYDYSCYNGPIGGCINSQLDFEGIRTSTENESILPHGNATDLIGMYNLSVSLKDTRINQDTQYVGSVLVTTSGSFFMLDQKSFYLRLFHGYSNYVFHSYYSNNGLFERRNEANVLYWSNDSLSMEYSLIEDDNGLKDTIRYSYAGTKQ